MEETAHTQKIYKRYVLELGSAMIAYAVALLGTNWAMPHVDDLSWRFAISLAPVVPGGLIAWAIVRILQQMDELHFRVQLHALAAAFGASALTAFSVGFLQMAGLPDLNWIFVWPMMALYWILGVQFFKRRYR